MSTYNKESNSSSSSTESNESTESIESTESTESSDEQDYQADNIDLTGEIVQTYCFIDEIGSGAYATVWLAYNYLNEKFVAIKVQHPDDYKEGKSELRFLKDMSSFNFPHINNLINSFIEKQGEKKYIYMVFELMAGNLDDLIRKYGWKKGLPEKCVKNITKQLLLSLQFLHNKMKTLHGDLKPENILIEGPNIKVYNKIEIYKEQNFNKLYQQLKNNYLEKKNIDPSNKKKVKKILKTKRKRKLRSQTHKIIMTHLKGESKIDLRKLLTESIETPKIRLTDFGEYCKEDEQFDEEYGKRYYRPPEGILIGDTNYTIDIWEFGCTIWELLTGDVLFNPNKDRNFSRDWYHLRDISDLCGKFSKKYLKTTERWTQYFSKNGLLKNHDKQIHNSWDKLKEEYDLSANFIDFIQKCIQIKQKHRFNVEQLLNHQWLNE